MESAENLIGSLAETTVSLNQKISTQQKEGMCPPAEPARVSLHTTSGKGLPPLCDNMP